MEETYVFIFVGGCVGGVFFCLGVSWVFLLLCLLGVGFFIRFGVAVFLSSVEVMHGFPFPHALPTLFCHPYPFFLDVVWITIRCQALVSSPERLESRSLMSSFFASSSTLFLSHN